MVFAILSRLRRYWKLAVSFGAREGVWVGTDWYSGSKRIDWYMHSTVQYVRLSAQTQRNQFAPILHSFYAIFVVWKWDLHLH